LEAFGRRQQDWPAGRRLCSSKNRAGYEYRQGARASTRCPGGNFDRPARNDCVGHSRDVFGEGPSSVKNRHGVRFGAYVDVAGRLSIAGHAHEKYSSACYRPLRCQRRTSIGSSQMIEPRHRLIQRLRRGPVVAEAECSRDGWWAPSVPAGRLRRGGSGDRGFGPIERAGTAALD
jgi:hypothetical protein